MDGPVVDEGAEMRADDRLKWGALFMLVSTVIAGSAASAQSTGNDQGGSASGTQAPNVSPTGPATDRPVHTTPPPTRPPSAEPARPAWMGPLTERDKGRIEDIVESRSKGRERIARDVDNKIARAAAALLDLDAIPLVEKQLLGAWQCRTYGLGGTLYPNRGADVSGAFKCRVERDREGLVLRKLTGSVTWLARLTPVTAHSLLYYGTYAARGDKNAIYPGGDAYNHQVGILQQLDRRRFRIEMPRPTHYATSDHDVVELFR
jgi:hypothetical protein